jgi:hypothetical protein
MALVFIIGANDGEDQTGEPQCRDLAEPIFAAGEERTFGAALLQPREDKRQPIPAFAVDVDG